MGLRRSSFHWDNKDARQIHFCKNHAESETCKYSFTAKDHETVGGWKAIDSLGTGWPRRTDDLPNPLVCTRTNGFLETWDYPEVLAVRDYISVLIGKNGKLEDWYAARGPVVGF